MPCNMGATTFGSLMRVLGGPAVAFPFKEIIIQTKGGAQTGGAPSDHNFSG